MTSRYNAPEGAGNEPINLAQIITGFFKAFKKLWFIMVIMMAVMGIVGYQRYRKNYVPEYQTRATFSITAPQYDGTEDQTYTNNSQLASVLSVSFNYLINNEVFYEIIKTDLGISQIPCTITISAVPDTNILSIMTSGSDAEMSYKVVQSVMENYDSVAEFVIGDTKLDVLEEPAVPTVPVNPYSPVKDTIMFIFIGMFIGVIPIVAYAFFVKKIENREDVEKRLNITFLGMLPGVVLNGKNRQLKNCSILNKEVGFRYLEAMRSINSRCEKELEKNHYKVILVTSTSDGEGKSTVALNLAYSLSKSQKKVMLIDGDLRKPSLHKMVEQKINPYKMEDFLERKIKSSQAIVNLEGTRVLLLAPNEPSKNAVQYLNSSQMERFIEESREVVDYVIIDAPPCSELSDAAILAKYSDGVVYVVKEDFVKVNKIIDTLQEFSYTRTPIIGCVLNSSVGKLNLTYGYGKHYSYGYNKGYGSRYYGRYGYGKYGYGYGRRAYGDEGYGEYGMVSEKEFRNKGRSVSKKIALETTEEQKLALQREREQEEKEEAEKDIRQNEE